MKSGSILDTIVERKATGLAGRKRALPLEELRKKAEVLQRKPISLYDSLCAYPGIGIIAEVKKASPSKGLIRENFLPLEIAGDYLKSGVQAMSVLTEEDFFQGDDEYLSAIREIAHIPLLRKDFLFDEYQIVEAYCIGADAVLLIAAILDTDHLSQLFALAKSLGMEVLVEIHNEEELDRVFSLAEPPRIVGINNRDLKTFEVDLKTTERLIDKIPQDTCVVSESGIRNREDMAYLNSLFVDAVLIGETLMRSESIPEAIRELRSGEEN